MLRTAFLLAACALGLLLPPVQAGAQQDVTRDQAMQALWTDWKSSLQNSNLIELQTDMVETPGREYVVGWLEQDNPDLGPTFVLTVVYANNGGFDYLMESFPVGGDGQYDLCGPDATLEAFIVNGEFAADLGLEKFGPEGVAIDDGMCDRIYVTAHMEDSGPVLTASRR